MQVLSSRSTYWQQLPREDPSDIRFGLLQKNTHTRKRAKAASPSHAWQPEQPRVVQRRRYRETGTHINRFRRSETHIVKESKTYCVLTSTPGHLFSTLGTTPISTIPSRAAGLDGCSVGVVVLCAAAWPWISIHRKLRMRGPLWRSRVWRLAPALN